MARINKLQANFTGGILSPRLGGRVDLAKYQTGLSQLHNFLVSPLGCVYRRPGSIFISQSETNTTDGSVLVPFEYSVTQAYILEFSDSTITFYKDQGQIIQSRGFINGTFDTDLTGWTDRDVGTGASTYSSGTMLLTGGGAANEARRYQSIANLGVSTYTVTCDIATANTVFRVGTTIGASDIASGSLTVGTDREFQFTPYVNGTVYIEFECGATSSVDNVVLNDPLYKINSPYTLAELPDIRWAQSFDVLYITHPNHPPVQIQRLGNDNWYLSDVVFDEPPYLDENLTTTTLTPSAVTGTSTITASTAIFAATDVGRAIRYKSGPDKTDVTNYTGTGSQTYYDIPFYPQGSSDLTVHFVEASGALTSKTYVAGVPGAGEYTITNGQVRTGDTATTSQRVRISPINAGSGEWGWGLITAYTSPTSVDVEVEVDFGGTNASTEWRLGSWSETTGHPRCICIHEQRLWFASNTNQPEYMWGSETANFTNFQPDNALRQGEIDNSTSVTFAVSGNGGQTIVWMASKGALILGTSSGVHSVRGSSGAISATNVTVKNEASVPCEFARVAVTNNEILFIERLGLNIRVMYYSFDIDGYAVEPMGLLAEHLGRESKYVDMSFQDSTSILWIRRANGSLCTATYLRGQQVNAWATQGLGGTDVRIESILSIAASVYNEVWMVVSRTIGGTTKRYLEVLSDEFIFGNVEDGIFVDSSLTYSGTSTTTVTGLGHLEGQVVTTLSEGAVVPNETVTSSQIVLDKATTKAIIGLGYNSYLETLVIEGGAIIGTAQSQIARIIEMSLKVFETVNLKMGYDADNLDRIIFRSTSDSMDTAVPLYSGFKSMKFPGGYNEDYKVYILQDQPLPCTILHLIFKAQVSDS